MSSDREWCLVVSPSPNRMMIVSGLRGGVIGVTTDSVEECIVVQ